eukprot:gene8461-10055_t
MTSIHGLESAVVVASNAPNSNCLAWDLQTGTLMKTYKGGEKSGSVPRNSMCPLGSEFLVTSQSQKGELHFWSLRKEQMLNRSFMCEPMSALCATRGGQLCAAGGGSGAVYIWEAASGRLLRSWAAHYKGITALTFSDDDSFLITASEDTVVHVWSVLALVDAFAQDRTRPPPPLFSWSEHTLPVVGLYCGCGGVSATVISASLDRSVKFWTLSK